MLRVGSCIQDLLTSKGLADSQRLRQLAVVEGGQPSGPYEFEHARSPQGMEVRRIDDAGSRAERAGVLGVLEVVFDVGVDDAGKDPCPVPILSVEIAHSTLKMWVDVNVPGGDQDGTLRMVHMHSGETADELRRRLERLVFVVVARDPKAR